MEFKLDKRYPLPVPLDAAWSVLSDIRATAACLPGAAITEQVDERRYKGAMKAKVGPATMNFAGEVEVQELDEPTRTLRMLGKGADKAGSSASMQLSARLEAGADAASSVLVGEATVVVSGKLAQFGSRLLVPVSDALLAQFVGNFAATAGQRATPADAAVASPPAQAVGSAHDAPSGSDAVRGADTGAGPGADPAPLPGVESVASPSPSIAPAAPAVATDPVPAATRPAAPQPVAPARELNALALLWSVFKHWLAGLFGRHRGR